MAKNEFDSTDVQPVIIYGHDGSVLRRLKVDATGKISVGESALPAGAATAAKQLPDGHNVTVDNASGAAAVNIQDGGNTITVDGAVTANAGTNLNTSALALETTLAAIKDTDGVKKITDALPAGTNLLGKVGVDQTTPGTTDAVVSKLYNSKTADYRPARADGITSALQIIDYAHHEVHAGSHFFVVGSADLPLNDVLDFTWVMPNTTKWIHWTWKITTSSAMAWYVYENAAIVNALANVVTPLNSDRNNTTSTSGTTMKWEIQADLAAANVDTNVATATLIKSGITGDGRDGGSFSRESELIMKQGATYCLRAVATAAGNITFDMEWYEHTNLS